MRTVCPRETGVALRSLGAEAPPKSGLAWSAAILSSQSAKSSAGAYSAASPQTSGMLAQSAVMIGHPCIIASSDGMPNPSVREGKARQSAWRNRAARSSSVTKPNSMTLDPTLRGSGEYRGRATRNDESEAKRVELRREPDQIVPIASKRDAAAVQPRACSCPLPITNAARGEGLAT